ncbi:MAG: hypothetical protein BZY75_01570 [SAR202 cluster bacterium Io17-Chloro-G7]|nr:MAG: hypothetical protein BZY75_01570 [SAR202 cluster bacterium Io17-Chloro-G7]
MKIGYHHKLTLFAGTLALLLLLASPGGDALAQGPSYSPKEALSIDRMLMCPVCPAETIDQAQVEISRQMKAVVREMLTNGASREEILDFFVARYGLGILAAPPKSGANLLVWVLPIAGVLAALAGAYLIIRSMSARSAQVTGASIPTTNLTEAGLAPFLEAVDRDLALSGDSGTTVHPTGASSYDSGRDSGCASNQTRNGVDKRREQEKNRRDDLEQNG